MFTLVVTEGLLEEPAARKLFGALGVAHQETRFIVKGGKDAFWRDAAKYNQAARHAGPVLGVADLESEPCPSGLIARHLPHGREPSFLIRIAERTLEAWLLADRHSIARFLGVPVGRTPKDPEVLQHPKRFIVDLARRSSRRAIVQDVVPGTGSSGVVGRGYASQMTQFIRSAWRPREASANSESLRRAIAAIEALQASSRRQTTE
jgi:hypothetical protein